MLLHPFLVHFPIAAWTLGSLILVVSLLKRFEDLGKSAWILLSLAAILSIPAVLSGQNDIEQMNQVQLEALDQHRDFGNLIPWLMIPFILLKGHFTFGKGERKPPEWLWALGSLVITGLILYVGWLGGSLIYEHGILEQVNEFQKK